MGAAQSSIDRVIDIRRTPMEAYSHSLEDGAVVQSIDSVTSDNNLLAGVVALNPAMIDAVRTLSHQEISSVINSSDEESKITGT